MSLKQWIVVTAAQFLTVGALASGYGLPWDQDYWPYQTWDPVSHGSIEIEMPDAEEALIKTVSNPKQVLEIYKPAIGKGVRVTKPKKVTGTATKPRMTMSIERCMGPFCQEVDLVGDAQVFEVTGECKYTWVMDIDISQSSEMISNQYDRMHVEACYRGDYRKGVLVLVGKVRRGEHFAKGNIQRMILEVLQSQFEPISEAIRQSLRKNSREPNSRLIRRHWML